MFPNCDSLNLALFLPRLEFRRGYSWMRNQNLEPSNKGRMSGGLYTCSTGLLFSLSLTEVMGAKTYMASVYGRIS